MFGTLFDKVTGLLDRRFVLGLLLPVFGFVAGVAALVATAQGWTATLLWYNHLGATSQVALGTAAAPATVFLALVLGSQVVTVTRIFEGYWPSLIDRTVGKFGR